MTPTNPDAHLRQTNHYAANMTYCACGARLVDDHVARARLAESVVNEAVVALAPAPDRPSMTPTPALTAAAALAQSGFTEYRKKLLTSISDIRFPPGTVYQTPEGLRAEDEETRCAFDVQGGIYPIRESVFQASYEVAPPSFDVETLLDTLLATNPSAVALYRAGKTQVVGFLVGQIMQAAKGQVNAAFVQAAVRERLDKEQEPIPPLDIAVESLAQAITSHRLMMYASEGASAYLGHSCMGDCALAISKRYIAEKNALRSRE